MDCSSNGRATAGRAGPSIEDLPAVDPCQSIGGERQLVVTIDDPVADQNWTEVRACLRGPNLAGLSAQIGAMLESVRWQR
jgi:hypothetical protein